MLCFVPMPFHRLQMLGPKKKSFVPINCQILHELFPEDKMIDPQPQDFLEAGFRGRRKIGKFGCRVLARVQSASRICCQYTRKIVSDWCSSVNKIKLQTAATTLSKSSIEAVAPASRSKPAKSIQNCQGCMRRPKLSARNQGAPK